MPELTPDIAAQVVAACQAGAAEAAAALGRTLDHELDLTVGEAAPYDPQQAPAGFDGPGLVVVLKCGETGAAVLLPQATELLPDWYQEPDPTGRSKLDTLAQELGMLLPEDLMAEPLSAAGVTELATALSRGEPAADAQLLPLTLKSGEHEGQLSLVWPLAKPAEVGSADGQDAAGGQDTAEAEETDAEEAGQADSDDIDISQVPPYERSLFKIRVPVTVTLATQRKPIQEIIELGPGSIVKFDKTCDELLQLIVGNRTLAEGEAVKVGDKFGLQISNMVRPEEHFTPLHAS